MSATRPQPLVSVVTPVYNGAQYLVECIESVLAQTYPAFEYLICDNCSTDGSLAIAQRYAERDPRVRVVAYDRHLSLHLAHWNRMMREISPDAAYVKVVHADDWIYAECVERMVAAASENPAIGVVGAYRLDDTRVTLDGLPYDVTFLPGVELARSSLLGGPWPHVFGAPTSLLVRADLVRKRERFYNEECLHADADVCLDLLSESDFGFVHQVLTYTRRHPGSVTSYAERVGTYIPDALQIYMRWGPVFLTSAEYDRKLVVRLLGYAGFLARAAPRWRHAEFRLYHRGTIRSLRQAVTAGQVARGLALQLRRSLGPR